MAKDIVNATAQVPADVVKAAAEELKNALDLVREVFDSGEEDADKLIDVASAHVNAAYQQALDLFHLAEKASA